MTEQSKLIVHDYKGFGISQRKSDGYVDLTQMCRIYHKRYPDWKRRKSTKAYIESVARSLQIPVDLVVITTLRGQNHERGSWGHRLVALHLAQWIDPEFALWCNQHLLELIETGITSIDKSVIDIQQEGTEFWDYLQNLMDLKPILSKDVNLAKQMFKHIYENF